MIQNRKQTFPFTFDPTQCGECEGICCTGKPGKIWVNIKEMKDMAKYLELSHVDFMHDYLNKVGNRWSVKERYQEDQCACIFFDIRQKRCNVYPVRPKQCRSYPYWNFYRDRVQDLLQECPGVIQID